MVTGYNGAPAGLPHCEHKSTCTPRCKPGHHTQGCTVQGLVDCKAAHAERNAIDWAARVGARIEGAGMVTTDTPCWQCAGSIINSGIVEVVALRPYRDLTGVRMLEQAGVGLEMFDG